MTRDAVSPLHGAFTESRARLVAFARRAGAGDDAEDVVQDVWLKLDGLTSPIANPEAYVHKAVYTAVLDRVRGNRRRHARDAAWHDLGQLDETKTESTERRIIDRQTLGQVLAHISALGEPTSTIFLRHRVRETPQKQIAEELGVSLTTVEKHLRRAYRALRDHQRGRSEEGQAND